MINVKINEETLLELLDERVKFWTNDETTRKLFSKMYENYAYSGCFDGMELDVMMIVDNDYINNCAVIENDDENFEKYLELGIGDISCEDIDGNFIEAITDDKDAILIRY